MGQHPLTPSQSGVGGTGVNLGEGQSARPHPGSTSKTGDNGQQWQCESESVFNRTEFNQG